MDRPRQVSGHTPSGQDLTQLEMQKLVLVK